MADELDPRLRLTDTGNARLLWQLHGANLRWVLDVGDWFAWDGHRWSGDGKEPVWALARDVATSLLAEAERIERAADGDKDKIAIAKAFVTWAKKSAQKSAISAMVELLKSEEGIVATLAQFDADPWALNTAAGLVDLRTGKMRPHRREDYCTKIAPAPTSAPCPRWEAWLADVFNGAGMRDFAQVALGYSITGSTAEQCLFFLPGLGSNGKSTLFRVLQSALGDYAGQTPRTLLMADDRPGTRHPTELTSVRGLRLAHSSETPEDGRIDETGMKALTGGDAITARYMHGNFFTFQPTHKLWLGTNHLPRVHGTEHAVWRRIRVLPMPTKFWRRNDPDRPEDGRIIDPALEPALLAETSAILGWLIRGAAEWYVRHSGGLDALSPPIEVVEATQTYRMEQDRLEQWLAEHCLVGASHTARSPELYADYTTWCSAMGERAESMRTWGRRMTAAGFEPMRANGANLRQGLRLASSQEQAAGWTGRRSAL